MTKVRICFDTSVICRLFDSDEHLVAEIETVKKLFRIIEEREQLQAVVAPVFWFELSDAPEEKIRQVVDITVKYSVADLPYQKNAETLMNAYIEGGVLSDQHRFDLFHIAYASIHGCRHFVSCDKKLARERISTRVHKINSALQHITPNILTPSELLEKLQ